jgi:hypothetical protein
VLDAHTVNDLRQSRRLDGGGAARSRTALRANISASCFKIMVSFCQRSCTWPSDALHPSETTSACMPGTPLSTCFPTSDTAIFPSSHTPGTVKLCESSSGAGGFLLGLRGGSDARDRTLASIVRRRGQPQFRERLLAIYDGRCAISGCNAVEALEAAHISPYKGRHTNHPQNGLLFR